MGFADLFADAHDVCLATFGLTADGNLVQFTPQDGSGTQIIDGIFRKTPLEEGVLPGRGNIVNRLWVAYTEILPAPEKGDVITINGSNYNIADVNVDRVGGAELVLRAS